MANGGANRELNAMGGVANAATNAAAGNYAGAAAEVIKDPEGIATGAAYIAAAVIFIILSAFIFLPITLMSSFDVIFHHDKYVEQYEDINSAINAIYQERLNEIKREADVVGEELAEEDAAGAADIIIVDIELNPDSPYATEVRNVYEVNKDIAIIIAAQNIGGWDDVESIMPTENYNPNERLIELIKEHT